MGNWQGPEGNDPRMEVPSAFRARKQSILAGLAVPEEQYQDRSPKGSVDEGIRSLIELLNGFDGLVTTSSCAGRVSLFVEGAGKHGPQASAASPVDDPMNGAAAAAATLSGTPSKGMGGHWLFVTHDAHDLANLPACFASLEQEGSQEQHHHQRGQQPASRLNDAPTAKQPLIDHASISNPVAHQDQTHRQTRPLIRLQFEPMV